MTSSQRLIRAALESAIGDDYYRLCDTHSVDRRPVRKVKVKDVLEQATGRLGLQSLGEPGRAIAASGLPDGMSAKMVIFAVGDIEWSFSMVPGDSSEASTLAIVCNEARVAAGGDTPDPPYPRPFAADAAEVVRVAEECLSLLGRLAATYYRQGG